MTIYVYCLSIMKKVRKNYKHWKYQKNMKYMLKKYNEPILNNIYQPLLSDSEENEYCFVYHNL